MKEYLTELWNGFLDNPFIFLFHDNMFSLYGSLLGVLGAYLVMKKQLNKEKEVRNFENEPLIVVNNTKNYLSNFRINYDLIDDGKKYNVTRKSSQIELPLTNIGRTAVYNLSYFFEINNLDEIKRKVENESGGLNPKIKEIDGEEYFCFSYEGRNSSINTSYKISKVTRFMSHLLPGETKSINVSSIVSFFWNYNATSFIYRKNPVFNPDISLYIVYTDYQHVKRTEEYSLEITRMHTNDTISGSAFLNDLEFDILTLKKPSSN